MKRLLYSLILLVIIATIGLGWLFDRMYLQYATPQTAKQADAVTVLEQMGGELAKTLNSLPQRQTFVDQWQADGNYNLKLMPAQNTPLPIQLLQSIKQGEPLLLESKEHLSLHFYLPNSDELLIIRAPLAQLQNPKEPLNYLFTLLFYVALVLLFLLWLLPLILQLSKLRQSAKLLGEGNLTVRVKSLPFSYLHDIEYEFNRMAQKIEGLVDDVKLLSSAVSHDLRTPLARIRFGVDTLEEEQDPQLRKKYHRKINSNIDEMTSLIETLLNYARLEQAMITLEQKAIDIKQLLNQCCNKYDANNTDITLSGDISNKIAGDKQYLKMAFNNLVHNACKYGGGKVKITISATEQYVTIEVSDNGRGIPKELEDTLFNPFVRGHHQNDNKGHGVGLATVKRIVEWHNGSIRADKSQELGGAKFILNLPVL